MTVIVYPDSGALAAMTVPRLCLALADAGALREAERARVVGGRALRSSRSSRTQ